MLPLYYRLLYGSVTDIKTIIQTITYLKEFGIEHFSLALDRVFFLQGKFA
jgi:transposase